MSAIKWQFFHNTYFGTTVDIKFVNDRTKRKDRYYKVAFRIEPTLSGSYRVDMKTIGPWEAIDGGKAPTSLRDAKALVERWVAEATEKRTLTPF